MGWVWLRLHQRRLVTCLDRAGADVRERTRYQEVLSAANDQAERARIEAERARTEAERERGQAEHARAEAERANAIKYNRENGAVTLSCRKMPPAPPCGNMPSGQSLRLEIADTGAGLSADDITRLFVPFERLRAES